MEDERIIDLYNARSQEAITQTDLKYGALCRSLAGRLLHSGEDVEECLNDTYLALWNAIPPAHPAPLSSFLLKITRNLAMKRLEHRNAAKRSAEAVLSFEELSECLSAPGGPEQVVEEQALREAITTFLEEQDSESRVLFLRRYFFFDSVKEIAGRYGLSESKVKSKLMRTRNKMKIHLMEEGFIYDW